MQSLHHHGTATGTPIQAPVSHVMSAAAKDASVEETHLIASAKIRTAAPA